MAKAREGGTRGAGHRAEKTAKATKAPRAGGAGEAEPRAASAKPPKRLRLGTRGSQLALAQSGWVASELRRLHPGLEVELQVVKTTGDADQATRLDHFAGMGVFVKELQSALLGGQVDFAVHSLKDVPGAGPADLVLAAFPEREDARDVLVSGGARFRDLPAGAKLGTGSPRRVVQLRALRPDLEYVPVRGNLDTRLRKVETGELQGVVLAAAGLRRLGLAERITHSFSLDQMVPAVGQGCLALECRAADRETRALLSALDHPATGALVALERRFQAALGGGCQLPMAAHAWPYGDGLRMAALLGDPGAGAVVRVEQGGDADDAEELLEEIIDRLRFLARERGIPIPADGPAR